MLSIANSSEFSALSDMSSIATTILLAAHGSHYCKTLPFWARIVTFSRSECPGKISDDPELLLLFLEQDSS